MPASVIENIEPGQVAPAIDPAFVELKEYLRLREAATEYLRKHSRLTQLLKLAGRYMPDTSVATGVSNAELLR